MTNEAETPPEPAQPSPPPASPDVTTSETISLRRLGSGGGNPLLLGLGGALLGSLLFLGGFFVGSEIDDDDDDDFDGGRRGLPQRMQMFRDGRGGGMPGQRQMQPQVPQKQKQQRGPFHQQDGSQAPQVQPDLSALLPLLQQFFQQYQGGPGQGRSLPNLIPPSGAEGRMGLNQILPLLRELLQQRQPPAMPAR